MNKNYFRLFILTLVMMPLTAYFLCQTFNAGDGMCWLAGLITLVMIIVTFVFAVDEDIHNKETEWKEAKILPGFKIFKGWLTLLFILSLIPIKQPAALWNQSVVAYNTYTQKCQQREGFYDKMYKTYSQKKEISFINFDEFKEIATVIMDNKKDGAALSWKWLSEQKLIDFQEFTSFWKDLSDFIELQREGYYALETECQQLGNANNILLSTFPNNVYNFFLHRPYAQYHYGFTSDNTERVFATHKENLK